MSARACRVSCNLVDVQPSAGETERDKGPDEGDRNKDKEAHWCRSSSIKKKKGTFLDTRGAKRKKTEKNKNLEGYWTNHLSIAFSPTHWDVLPSETTFAGGEPALT